MHRSQSEKRPREGASDMSVVRRAIYERINEGESSFTVEMPRAFCSEDGLEGSREREFFFSDLTLVPGYFSEKASELGVDADAVERKSGGPSQEHRLNYEVHCRKNLYFDATTGTAQDKFHQQRNRAFDLDDLVVSVNDYFEQTKPAEVVSLPFFIDWIDLGWTSQAFQSDPVQRSPERVEEEEETYAAFEQRLAEEEERARQSDLGEELVRQFQELEEEQESVAEAVAEDGGGESAAAAAGGGGEKKKKKDKKRQAPPQQKKNKKKRQRLREREGK